MWQRQSIFSISSLESNSTAVNDTTTDSINTPSDAPTDRGLVDSQQEQQQHQQQRQQRPAVFRNSTIDNADQENSLRDRIRYLTSGGIMASPFHSPHDQQTNPNINRQQVYTPRRTRSRAPSLANSVDHRLSIIDEDNPSSGPHHQPEPLPPRPVRTSHRPLHRRFGLGEHPKYEGGGGPPGYSSEDVLSKRGEKLQQIRNNPFIARRGGFRRICLIFLILLVIILALSIGLGVGLSKNKKNR